MAGYESDYIGVYPIALRALQTKTETQSVKLNTNFITTQRKTTTITINTGETMGMLSITFNTGKLLEEIFIIVKRLYQRQATENHVYTKRNKFQHVVAFYLEWIQTYVRSEWQHTMLKLETT